MKILENMLSHMILINNVKNITFPVHSSFYQIGIDFVEPLPKTKEGNKYIIMAIDYLIKWSEAKAVSEAIAKQTAIFIYEEIIYRYGCLTKILSVGELILRIKW